MTPNPERVLRRALSTALAVCLAAAGVVGVAAVPAGAASSDSNKLTVEAGEYAYKVSGKPKPGWVEIEFDNQGIEYHMMEMVPLKKGVTAKQFKRAIMSDAEDAFEKIAAGDVGYGAPQLVAPRTTSTTITQLPAGSYGILCFVPDPEGEPHIAHGMFKVLKVKGSKSAMQPPRDGVRDVTITDSSITLPSNGVPRTGWLKVTNDGNEQHSLVLAKLETGKSMDDVFAYFSALFEGGEVEGPEPGTLIGGVARMDPKTTAYLQLDLASGAYGYASVEGDEPDDDFSKGLKGEFQVS